MPSFIETITSKMRKRKKKRQDTVLKTMAKQLKYWKVPPPYLFPFHLNVLLHELKKKMFHGFNDLIYFLVMLGMGEGSADLGQSQCGGGAAAAMLHEKIQEKKWEKVEVLQRALRSEMITTASHFPSSLLFGKHTRNLSSECVLKDFFLLKISRSLHANLMRNLYWWAIQNS